MPTERHFYAKVFLDAFDGNSEDMMMLSPAQRYIWFAYIAFARRYPPHGFLSTGSRAGHPIPASIRRLAEWAGVSVGVIHKINKRLLELGMLHIDKRRKDACLEVTNWQKWQSDEGKI